jgi:hypothetical protein
LGRIDFGEPIKALPTACTCETSRRRTNAHGQDPDHSRANEPLRVREVAMCTGQQRVARVPPADREPPGVLLTEEAGLLLDTQKGACPWLSPVRRLSLDLLSSEPGLRAHSRFLPQLYRS